MFETATPFDTSRLMAELVAWFEAAHKEHNVHPLLAIGVFVVVFLAIHPFQDGNGRLSRLFSTTLVLLRAGYGYVPYSSLESVIELAKQGSLLRLRFYAKRRGPLRRKSRTGSGLAFVFSCVRSNNRCNGLAKKVEREKLCTPF